MRRRLMLAATPLLGATLAVGAAATPAGATASAPKYEVQVVKLSGAQEVPPADLDGRGIFVSRADLRRGRLCYVLIVKDIAAPRAAHIHNAPAGSNGPITIGLANPAEGHSADCITAVPDDQQTAENAGMTLTISELRAIVKNSPAYYVNVHNADFPAGAVRGQLR